MNLDECIVFGKPTPREQNLITYLGECIAQSIEKHSYDRQELMCAISLICTLLFTSQTPLQEVEEQCKEIDIFCEYLKLRARDK